MPQYNAVKETDGVFIKEMYFINHLVLQFVNWYANSPIQIIPIVSNSVFRGK